MKSITAFRPLRAFIFLGMIVLGALSLSACNTVEGAGKDIERAGEKVQDASDR